MSRALPVVLSFALAVLWAACGGNVIVDSTDAGPSNLCVPDGGTCAVSTDCCPGEFCSVGACIPGCQTDDDCPPPCDVCMAGACVNACSG